MVVISRDKAKRLGIADADRKTLTQEQLSTAESGSGQYDVSSSGKTTLKEDVRADLGKDVPKKVTSTTQTGTATLISDSRVPAMEAEIAALPEGDSAASIPGVEVREDALKPTIDLTQDTPEVQTPEQAAIKTGIAEFRERETLLGKTVKIITSGKTTAVLAAVATVLSGVFVFGGTAIATAATGPGSITLMKTAHEVSRATGSLIPRGTVQFQRALSGATPIASGVGKLFRVPFNAKVAHLTAKVLTKKFTAKAIVFAGSWAGSVFLGRWGQAEAAEPITIPLRDALKLAKDTGDYELYNEYSQAAKEITDLSTWQQIMLWSPIAAIPGIMRKLKGVRTGIELLDKLAEQQKTEVAEEGFEESSKRIADESRQRELEERARDNEYYRLIREGNYTGAQDLLEKEMKGG